MIKVTGQRELAATDDHVLKLARTTEIRGVVDLVSNALDADAENIDVRLEPNKLGGYQWLEVEDDGHGLRPKDVAAFAGLGGSWKKVEQTSDGHRRLLGSEGEGRYRALAIGTPVEWMSAVEEGGEIKAVGVRFSKANPRKIEDLGSDRVARGTCVRVWIVGTTKLTPESIRSKLVTEFARYLKHHGTVRVRVNDVAIDPAAAMQSERETMLSLPDGSAGTITFVAWKDKTSDRVICVCDEGGGVLSEEKMTIHTPGERFSAYIQSHSVAALAKEHAFDTALHVGANKMRDAINAAVKDYYKELVREREAEFVRRWKEEDSYPYTTEPANEIEHNERAVWNRCAVVIAEELKDFDKVDLKWRKLQFQLLRTAIEREPQHLGRILESVFGLSVEQRREFSELLERSELSQVIGMARVVRLRQQALADLRAIVFDPETAKRAGETRDLHPFLARNAWLFGDRFVLSTSERSIRNALLRLRVKAGLPKIDHEDTVAEERAKRRLDLLFTRDISAGSDGATDHLVVEIKRPSVTVGSNEMEQINHYADLVTTDPEFKDLKGKWTFICVSTSLAPETERRTRSPDRPRGMYNRGDTFEVYAKRWNEIIGECSSRLEFIEKALPDATFADVAAIRERAAAKRVRKPKKVVEVTTDGSLPDAEPKAS